MLLNTSFNPHTTDEQMDAALDQAEAALRSVLQVNGSICINDYVAAVHGVIERFVDRCADLLPTDEAEYYISIVKEGFYQDPFFAVGD